MQPNIITGHKDSGKSQIDNLAQRIRRLEEEVEGVEPPKSKEMQKIEELEEKIDKLLFKDNVKEEYQDMAGHEVVDKVREENTLDTEESREDIEDKMEEALLEEGELKEPEEIGNEELSAKEGRCKHCGEVFDNRGLSQHEPKCDEKHSDTKVEGQKQEYTDEDKAQIIREDLTPFGREVLDRMSRTNYKSSKLIARAFEDKEQGQVADRNKKLKKLGLVESITGKGSKLTEKGAKVKEAEVNLPDYSEEEKLPLDEYSVSERKKRIVEEIEDSYKPLTRHELVRRIYKIPRDTEIETNDSYYNRIEGALNKLRTEEMVQKSRLRDRISSTAWELSDKAFEEASSNETKEVSVSESMEWEEVKRKAGVNDSDIDVVKLAFDKMINRKGMETVSYHDFEQHYEGEESPLRMFQKLFQSPNLLDGVRERVLDGEDLKWSKKGEGTHGTGAKNWVIKVE